MKRVTAAPVLAAALALAACGGGEVIAIVQFIGSAGGDWVVDDPTVAGFQPRSDCGTSQDQDCFVNLQIDGVRSLYATGFGVTYTGNLPGCPAGSGADPAKAGTVSGERISLPGCFSGRYLTINEALSDDGLVRAYFDSEAPNLTEGVWVEIQDGQRRFKFTSDPGTRTTTDIGGCELSAAPPNALDMTVVAADLGAGRLQTEITAFTVAGQTWSGRFVGISAMKLTRGSEVLELQRRDLPGTC
jgi:hypothetical protein